MQEIEKIVQEFSRENGIEATLSSNMPAGYETAYGTYDVTINTLFLNVDILQDAPRYEVLFYLFHELRHALQYQRPMLFDAKIRESICYVILYNGTCFKLVDNRWKECVLAGDEGYFTRAYMSLPYEIDANTFAYEKTREICGDSAELKGLLDFWIPKDSFDYEEHQKLFFRIDEKVIYGTRRAADLGDCKAQYEFARFYEEGVDVPRDMEQAIFWYRKAALQNHDLAIQKCKELGVDLNATTIDCEVIRKALECRIYPLGYLERYKYTVICTSYDGKWILSRHKKRNTWETQGGHIEDGETPLECAKRELFEESGIRDADIYPVCDYWGFNSQACSNGMVFLAVVHSLGELPESEMKEIKIFDTLPDQLTYPKVSPKLYAEAEKEFIAFINSNELIPVHKVRYADYFQKLGYVQNQHMLSKTQYLANPCRAASIPCWKMARLKLPADMCIVHEDEFDPGLLEQYTDETYFRLKHDLQDLATPQLPEGFAVCAASIREYAQHINGCYAAIGISESELQDYTQRQVYCPDLWLAVRDTATGEIAATGIAELDREIHEGVLEWIQVSPQYRGRGLGKFLVLELLSRMKPTADFTTVSGQCSNPTSPERLYRSCGFTGDDVWHILRRKAND